MKSKSKSRKAEKNRREKIAWRTKRSCLKRAFISALEREVNPTGHIWQRYNLEYYYPKYSKWVFRLERISQGMSNVIKENHKYSIDIPTVFCLKKNPDETIRFLNSIDELFFKLGVRNVHLSHENTTCIGLAASYLFDEKIQSAKRYFLRNGLSFKLSGRISKDRDVNNFLLANGIFKKLGLDPSIFKDEYVDFDYESKYMSVLFRGSSADNLSKSKACIGLVDYFNCCLNHVGYRINAEGKSDLVSAISEIIDNAEEHAGTQIKWIALGCFNKDTKVCNFAIISPGRSIFEALSDENSTVSKVISEVEDIVHSHRLLGGVFSRRQEEPLWNVMALQEGISSKRSTAGDNQTRGQGLMDVIEFMDALRADDISNNLSIISGRSSIQIDFSYRIFTRVVGKSEQRVRTIVFNKRRDLHYPMDSEKVRLLKNKYRGTVLTGTLKLDKKYLDSITGDKKNE